ncbi:hypothetical protein CK934_10750 [Chitinophaga sp. MD30]|nr:hypothetical protein CK934_10750 [Chitinophaga sp. MD30]
MTIPVMKRVLEQHPDIQIVFVTNKNWGALCKGVPRLIFYPADVKGVHKGFPGLFRLFRAIRKEYTISAVADLHNVLRAKVVSTLFALSGKRVARIDKGRTEKKALTRQEDKILQPLMTTIERYAIVFRQLGLPCDMSESKPLANRLPLSEEMLQLTGEKHADKWIGIAPFATYREKMYPLNRMEEVLGVLSRQPQHKVLLFGGGAAEVAQLSVWASQYPNTVLIAGKCKLESELHIISQLEVMVSMDSANMHLAALFGIPVVSVWGATHPYAGFMGYQQSLADAVQVDDLSCRPCSVFGNKPCFRGDHACMEWIPALNIADKVLKRLETPI